MSLNPTPVLPGQNTPVSRGGLAIARKIADVYRAFPAVRAFIVGGSVSRDCADMYSDLEIGVFWDEAVPTEERRDAVKQLDSELWTIDRDGRFMEHFGLYNIDTQAGRVTGRCMVSMNHNTIAQMEDTLASVLQRWDTNPDHQELIFAVQHAVVFYGNELVTDWQTRAATFPDELAAKIVQENLTFGPWFIPEAYLLRNDPLVLYNHYLTIQHHLIRLLLGLNRLYLPSTEFKWLDQMLARITIAPDRLAERLRAAFQTPDLYAGWQDLKALLFETLDRVDKHLPLVNTQSFIPSQTEFNTAWARKRWDPLPPYTLMQRVGQAEGGSSE